MTNFLERIIQVFGEKTPEHKIRASVQNGIPKFELEMLPLKNLVVVKYAPGTDIRIDPDMKYRPFGEDEVIHAKSIYFFGAGMSNGTTAEGRYFKAMGDPIEITPLVTVESKQAKSNPSPKPVSNKVL